MRDWLNIEDESYFDQKIDRWDVRFPSHEGEKLNGDVTTYSIDELNKK
jgi:hypothetical protein